MKAFPKFYHPSRRGLESDKRFIESKLSRLSDANRQIASDHYEKLFMSGWSKTGYAEGRDKANQWLNGFVNEYGITKEEHERIVASDASKKRVLELIERCKAAKPKASRTLDYADRKKDFKKSAI